MKILLLSAALLSASAISATTTVSYDWGKVLTNGTTTANIYDAQVTADGNWYTVFGTAVPQTIKWGDDELNLPDNGTKTASKALITKTSATDGSFLWSITSTFGAFTFANGRSATTPDGGLVVGFTTRKNEKSVTNPDPISTLVDAKNNTINITEANYPSTWAYLPMIMKISAEGEIEWIRQIKDGYPTADGTILALTTDEAGNIYIAGSHKAEISFPTSATEWSKSIAATANATKASYIAKFDKDGYCTSTFSIDATSAYATSDQIDRLVYADGTLYWVGSVTGLTDGTTYTIGNTTVTPTIATVNDAALACPTLIAGSMSTDLVPGWTTVIESKPTTASKATILQNKALSVGANGVYAGGALNGGMSSGDVELQAKTAALYGYTLAFDKTTGAIKGGNLYDSSISLISGIIENTKTGNLLTYGYLMSPAKIFLNELSSSTYTSANETTLLSLGTTSGYGFNTTTNQFLSLSYGKGGDVLTDAASLGTLSAFSATVVAFTLSDSTTGIDNAKVAATDGVKVYGIDGAAVFTANAAQNIAVYSATGALVKVAAVAEGSTTVELPAGFYIAAGQKFIVK